MTTRLERVVLDLEDRFTGDMLTASAATAGLRHELDRLDGAGGKVDSSQRKLGGSGGSLEQTSRSADRQGRSIDKLSGRLAILGHTLAAVGPAAVPITAVAIPAVVGLSSELGFAAVGAGTMALAFHGLGDALNKFNKAEAEPTATNIEAARLAMDKLSPSAQRFVLELHSLNPEIDRLKRSAGEDLFPGLTEGLAAVQQDGPIAERILHDVGGALGGLGERAGRSLASDRWKPFLRFVDREAPDAVQHLGNAVGDVTHGLASLWMAFDPLNDDVDAGVVRLARDFDQWATSLGKAKDFQSFIEYVQTNGPKVTQLLGETRDLFVDIVQAAAPLGGPTLDALNLIVHALDLVASSPLATPLLLLLQVNSVLALTSRGLKAVGVDAKIGMAGVTTGAREGSASLRGLRAEALSAGQALRQIGTNVGRNASGGTPLLTGVNREGLANLAKGAALAGGMAFAMSGLDQKMGLTNTTALTLAGSFAGPWGAAAGAAVGLTMDIAHANDDLTESLHRLHSALDGSGTVIDLKAQAAAIGDVNTQFAAMQAKQQFPDQGLHPLASTQAWLSRISDTLNHNTEKTLAEQAAAREATTLQNMAIREIYGDMGGTKVLGDNGLQAVANRAAPAMQALGISVDDLRNAAHAGDGSLEDLTGQIVAWINRADSARGSTRAVADAFSGMADETLTLDQRVGALSDAFDRKLLPGLNQAAATDAWQHSLRHLNDDLAKNRSNLMANTDAGEKNRAAVRNLVTEMKDKIIADAAAGTHVVQLTQNLAAMRKRLIDAADAAGISRDQVKRYADQLGLTPRFIETVLHLKGDAALQLAKMISAELNSIHDKTVRITMIRSTGGHSIAGDAEGGTIPKTGLGYADRHLRLLADGEEVISDRYGQATRWRPLLKAINARQMSDGGSVMRDTMSRSSAQRVQVDINAGSLTGSINTPWGVHPLRAEIEAIVREVHAAERSEDDRYDRRRAMA